MHPTLLLALAFLASSLSIVPGTARANVTPWGPEVTFQSPTFDESTAGALERQLARIAQHAEHQCLELGQNHPSCQFAKAYEELLETGRIIAASSFDPNRLSLTLAARLHPFDILSLAETNTPFDSVYSRYLIAQRLIRETISKMQEQGEVSGSKEVLGWMTAKTPFSYYLSLARQWSCLRSDDDCQNKRLLIGMLQTVFEAIDEDQELGDLISLKIEETASPLAGSEKRKIYQLLLETLSGETNGNMLVFGAGAGYSSFDQSSAANYLSSVDDQASFRLSQVYVYSGSACQDISMTLKAARTEEAPWSHLITGGFNCSEKEGRLYSISGEAYDTLTEHGQLWNFNFFQTRLLVRSLFSGMNRVDPLIVEKMQIHEALADYARIKAEVSALERVNLTSSQHEELRPVMNYLYSSILELLSRSDQILGELKND